MFFANERKPGKGSWRKTESLGLEVFPSHLFTSKVRFAETELLFECLISSALILWKITVDDFASFCISQIYPSALKSILLTVMRGR